MGAPGLVARQAAAVLLTGVLADGKMLSEQIDAKDGPLVKLEPSERARAQTIANGVLRHLDALDGVLDQYLKKAPPLKVIQVLRIAAWEMLIDRVPSHAAVDAAVNAVKAARKVSFLSGLTNAVARKISKTQHIEWTPEPQLMPKDLRKPMVTAYGNTAIQKIEALQAGEPPLDITVKHPAKRDEIANALGAEVLPTGSLRLREWGQVSKLEGFDAGDWWVQDAAAAMPVKLLGDIEGRTALDLCAAPGGKTMQLAAAGAKVLAVDNSPQRMKRVEENLARTKLKADLVTSDILKWKPETKFDVILLDAPCSATGTIRRHPDLPFVRKGVALKPLLQLQARLIARAASWLAPNGRLLYCTCSLLPAEGEDHLKTLTAHGYEVEKATAEGIEADWFNEDNSLRLRPDYWADRGGMDGFFAAVLRKAG